MKNGSHGGACSCSRAPCTRGRATEDLLDESLPATLVVTNLDSAQLLVQIALGEL